MPLLSNPPIPEAQTGLGARRSPWEELAYAENEVRAAKAKRDAIRRALLAELKWEREYTGSWFVTSKVQRGKR